MERIKDRAVEKRLIDLHPTVSLRGYKNVTDPQFLIFKNCLPAGEKFRLKIKKISTGCGCDLSGKY